MNGSLPVPGEYSFTELGEIFSVSRKTAEAYKDRFKLEYKELVRNNRAVHGVVLTSEDIEKILSSITPSGPKFVLPEGRVESTETVSEPRRMVDEELLEEYRNRLEVSEDEKNQLKSLLDSLKEQNMNEKIKVARLEKDIEKLEALNAQLSIRLEEKDGVIETLRSHIDAEKSRADSFNNQIRGLNDKIQTMRTGSTPADLERWMQNAYEKQKQEVSQLLSQKLQIEVQEALEAKNRKGFRIFGIEISRASNRWEGSLSKRRPGGPHKRPRYYQ